MTDEEEETAKAVLTLVINGRYDALRPILLHNHHTQDQVIYWPMRLLGPEFTPVHAPVGDTYVAVGGKIGKPTIQ